MPTIGPILGNDDDDDKLSTSTVASTVGTGLLSLASRMSALNVDFGDKLHAEEGHTIEEEDEEGDGSRSDRTDRTQRTMNTVNTVQTEDREDRDSVLEDTISRWVGAASGKAPYTPCHHVVGICSCLQNHHAIYPPAHKIRRGRAYFMT